MDAFPIFSSGRLGTDTVSELTQFFQDVKSGSDQEVLCPELILQAPARVPGTDLHNTS